MKEKNYRVYLLMHVIAGFLSALTVFLLIYAIKSINVSSQYSRPSKIRRLIVPIPTPVPTPAKNRLKSQYLQKRTWTGKVSHYSREGCLGCSPTLTMANGQPLDDNALTIAFNYLPLGSRVKLTNLDNGKSIVAEVTDTGGFTGLGRIADLTPKVASALASKTDVSNILIEEL